MNPKDAWLACKGQLELQLSPAAYDTWLRECKFVAYENGVFIVSVQNAFARDWLEDRLYRSICHALSDVMRQATDVEIIVATRKQEDTDRVPLKDGGLPLMGRRSAPPQIAAPVESEPPQYTAHYGSDWATGYEDAAYADDWDPGLQPNSTFENFVVGPSNQMAQAAADAVARAPGQFYNPLFIYGDVGLGKTHLLQAIGNECHQRGLKVLYTSSEEFTNELVESIRNKNTAAFREHFRHVDVLMIDDIQFIAGKESTQEEFFHTFNALHNHGKQVVLAADRPPSQMRGLEKRLVSRMEWGLQVDIQPPTFETRLAIVHDKAEVQGYRLPPAVAEVVAQQRGSIRALEGMVTKLIAFLTVMQRPLTVEVAENILAGHANGATTRPRDIADTRRRLSINQVLEGTATALQLELKDLVGKRRTKDVSEARQLAIYIVREETQASWPEIGNALGGRNHSTMLYNYNRVAEQIATDPDMKAKLQHVMKVIREQAG